jgi:hypothetical protein
VVGLGPTWWAIGGEDELEEAEVGEAVCRDNFPEELAGSEALVGVVVGRGRRTFRDLVEKRQAPGRARPVVVDDETVAREEHELGIAEQGAADEE